MHSLLSAAGGGAALLYLLYSTCDRGGHSSFSPTLDPVYIFLNARTAIFTRSLRQFPSGIPRARAYCFAFSLLFRVFPNVSRFPAPTNGFLVNLCENSGENETGRIAAPEVPRNKPEDTTEDKPEDMSGAEPVP